MSRPYTDKFKAGAVALLESQGFPNDPGALDRVYQHLGQKPAKRTLMRWFHGENGAPDDKLVRASKKELADVFEDVAYKYLNRAGEQDAVDETKGKDAVMTAAIAVDKMRLLRGLPTEIVVLVPGFIEAIKKLGQDPEQVMRRAIERAGLGEQYLQ